MTCAHRNGHNCSLVCSLAGLPIVDVVTDAACEVCSGSTPPCDRNKVTLDLAVYSLLKGGQRQAARKLLTGNPDIYGSVSQSLAKQQQRLDAVLASEGVGSQLWRLLESLGIQHRADCACLQWAERMNAWGPAGCRKARQEIVQHMQASAANYGWLEIGAAVARAIASGLALRLSMTDPYGSLLDEAIRRAESLLPVAPIDILLPLGPGSKHKDAELRYALRSIFKHAKGLHRVVVVGAIPKWLRETDQVLPVRRKEFKCNKASRISLKIAWSFENLELTETVAFWNDDYVLLRDYDIRTMPPYYCGLLWRKGVGGWQGLLNHTAKALQNAGLPQRHYDIHVPILLERDKFLALAEWWSQSRSNSPGYVMKSVYGNNHCTVVAQKTRDMKLKSNWRQRIARLRAGRWVMSYGDATMRAGFGEWLGNRYPLVGEFEQQAKAAVKQCKGC